MGIAVFLFTKLLLKIQKSMLNFRQLSLSNRLMACTRKASEFSRMMADQRKALQDQWNNYYKGQVNSNNHQGNLDGAMAGNIFQQCNFKLSDDPMYLSYQNALKTLEYETEQKQRIDKAEEDEIQHELDTVKTQVALIEEQLKATDEGLNSAVKDSAPKYC